MSVVTRAKAGGTGAVARGKRYLAAARRRSPAFDHLVRSYLRYDGERGNQLAGAVTFFGFLAFFPLLALAFSVAGYAVVVYPEARDQLLSAVTAALPAIGDQLRVGELADARAGAGAFGLIGLLIAGLGWIDALREALHRVWLADPTGGGNIVVKKLVGVAVLVLFGGCLLASVAVSSLATTATRIVLEFLGLGDAAGAGWVLRILAVAVVLLFDTAIFLLLFWRLSGTRQPLRVLVRGAVLGAAGFEVLKLVGTAYIPRVASDPVYGTFGLVVGLLVWINLISRFTLYAGAWTATSSGDTASSGDFSGDPDSDPDGAAPDAGVAPDPRNPTP